MSYNQKLINVSFALASGSFGDSGGNTANITGLRVSVHIEVAGGPQQSHMELAIYGLPLSMMNQLTTFGSNYLLQQKNGVQVFAGEAGGQMSLVFQGNIFQAWVDAQALPQVCLRVVATPGSFYNSMPQTPLSFQGPTPAATVAQKIAGYLGMQFENNGVKTVLSNPYYASDAVSMIRKLAQHGGFDFIMDKGTLAITPVGTSRSGDTPSIAPPKMVGYPIFISNNLVVKSIFDPTIKYNGDIQVTSSLTPANGKWRVSKLEYDLESKVPHGRWFNVMTCVKSSDTAPAS